MMALEVQSIIGPATEVAPLSLVPLALGLFSEGIAHSAISDGGTNLNEQHEPLQLHPPNLFALRKHFAHVGDT
jgi:hypothetical protein